MNTHPQLGFNNQRQTIVLAMVYGSLLNRTVVIPDTVAGSAHAGPGDWADVYDVARLASGPLPVVQMGELPPAGAKAVAELLRTGRKVPSRKSIWFLEAAEACIPATVACGVDADEVWHFTKGRAYEAAQTYFNCLDPTKWQAGDVSHTHHR